MSARAEELSGGELERDAACFDMASQEQGLPRRWALDDVLAPAPYRLYRATVVQHWVLEPDNSPRRPRRGYVLGRCERTAPLAVGTARSPTDDHFSLGMR